MTQLLATAARYAHQPGAVGLSAALVLLAILIAFGGPVHALLAGAAIGVAVGKPLVANAGKAGTLALQAGIVLLAFRMDFSQLATIGSDYLLWVGLYVPLTLLLGLVLARALGIEMGLGKLLSCGTAICGGTAIATLAPTIRARSDQLALALAIVFLFNGVAVLVFPAIGNALGLSQEAFGVWSALAVHDTSSVVATASAYGDESLVVATTLKLGRTLFLIPVALLFAMVQPQDQDAGARVRVPAFVLLFVGATVVNSLLPMPQVVVHGASWLSHAFFVVALFLVGAQLRRATLEKVRGRALAYAAGLWLVVIGASLAAVVHFV